EWVHVQLHQQKGMISLSPPTICNSAEHTHQHYGILLQTLPGWREIEPILDLCGPFRKEK
ncbi:hypothetical protein, partial [Escherichia coli]|uniref:hypothetical protein n=1 Tax=Escherichia coli TaxID=562 RepID=UPI001CBF0D5C